MLKNCKLKVLYKHCKFVLGMILTESFFLITFKQKIILPWFNLTLPKNPERKLIKKWGNFGNLK